MIVLRRVSIPWFVFALICIVGVLGGSVWRFGVGGFRSVLLIAAIIRVLGCGVICGGIIGCGMGCVGSISRIMICALFAALIDRFIPRVSIGSFVCRIPAVSWIRSV